MSNEECIDKCVEECVEECVSECVEEGAEECTNQDLLMEPRIPLSIGGTSRRFPIGFSRKSFNSSSYFSIIDFLPINFWYCRKVIDLSFSTPNEFRIFWKIISKFVVSISNSVKERSSAEENSSTSTFTFVVKNQIK